MAKSIEVWAKKPFTDHTGIFRSEGDRIEYPTGDDFEKELVQVLVDHELVSEDEVPVPHPNEPEPEVEFSSTPPGFEGALDESNTFATKSEVSTEKE